MTNEEAIKILKDTAFLAYQNASLDEINEAVGMAIEALELSIVLDRLIGENNNDK